MMAMLIATEYAPHITTYLSKEEKVIHEGKC